MIPGDGTFMYEGSATISIKDRAMVDNINHPAHYNNHPSGVECITVVEHMSYNVGNAVKYLWRHGQKQSGTLGERFRSLIKSTMAQSKGRKGINKRIKQLRRTERTTRDEKLFFFVREEKRRLRKYLKSKLCRMKTT